jgi:hypothetical protein
MYIKITAQHEQGGLKTYGFQSGDIIKEGFKELIINTVKLFKNLMGLNIILKGGRIGCIPPKPKGKGFLQPIR